MEIIVFGIKPFSSFPVQKYCVHSEKRLSSLKLICALLLFDYFEEEHTKQEIVVNMRAFI